ncbi:MAG: hypothetical protein MUD12_03140 [Spirochaetes bacterium]|jgi:hypothetical protein|nr:hypothetical protein [Spirochaetota bacterium]
MNEEILQSEPGRVYRDLWNHNIQTINELHQKICASVRELESDYTDFEHSYRKIEEMIKTLSSICAGYNVIEGKDYILKLKALIEHYRKRYTREGISFDLINFLLVNISDLRNKSLEQFPYMEHQLGFDADESGPGAMETQSLTAHRWITFSRNRSWFILPYGDALVIEKPEFETSGRPGPERIEIVYSGRAFTARDLMSKFTPNPPDPGIIIMTDRGRENYAADEIGKRINADRDFIWQMIRPLDRSIPGNILAGRVRIFGKRHFFINPA